MFKKRSSPLSLLWWQLQKNLPLLASVMWSSYYGLYAVCIILNKIILLNVKKDNQMRSCVTVVSLERQYLFLVINIYFIAYNL